MTPSPCRRHASDSPPPLKGAVSPPTPGPRFIHRLVSTLLLPFPPFPLLLHHHHACTVQHYRCILYSRRRRRVISGVLFLLPFIILSSPLMAPSTEYEVQGDGGDDGRVHNMEPSIDCVCTAYAQYCRTMYACCAATHYAKRSID